MKKLYRFLEALDKIVGTKRRIRKNTDAWHTYNVNDRCLENSCTASSDYWPTLDDQKAKMWEVEPEPIYVWGVCGGIGTSLLFYEEPKKTVGGGWLYESDAVGHHLITDNLFSKNKPQKFKLVLVEDK